MPEVVIIDAVRTPIGRKNGGLASVHPADLLAGVLRELVSRTGINPAQVDQIVGGCVSQVGQQSFNLTRTAWLSAGLPLSVAATTIDTQCGSSQQATSFATALVAGGIADVAIACGVESMSRVPIGSNSSKKLGFGVPIPKSYFDSFEFISQFEGAERIAHNWGISRQDCDEFGLRSQQRAAAAWEQGRFESQIVSVQAPELDAEGAPTGINATRTQDEGLRDTTLEKLASLKPIDSDHGVHTAGSASQISDGAAAVLIMSAEKAATLGLTPRAKVLDSCMVGVDPVLMLTGPIEATRRMLARTKMSITDFDLFEINEAFASVVLAWAKEVGADLDRTNPNGGAIALGHPLGATGAFLITKALNELERTDATNALISMCCGGGLGTGTIIERL